VRSWSMHPAHAGISKVHVVVSSTSMRPVHDIIARFIRAARMAAAYCIRARLGHAKVVKERDRSSRYSTLPLRAINS